MIPPVRIFGLQAIPLVERGDDLAKLVLRAIRLQRLRLEDGDILVISHKIASKAEGRIIDLHGVHPNSRAYALSKKASKDPRLIHIILRESGRLLKARKPVLLVETRMRYVCLNAGVDKSNVKGRNTFALLPFDPDRSARSLAMRLRTLTGRRIGVIVSDTSSRPFRKGQVQFAIGAAGFNPIVDYRGERDLFGYRLKHKFVGLADELASAAELVMGQGSEGIPAALVKGLRRARFGWRWNARKSLSLRKSSDLFKIG